jgi:hypothetical protein
MILLFKKNKMNRCLLIYFVAIVFSSGCGKSGHDDPPAPPGPFRATAVRLNSLPTAAVYYNISAGFKARFSFNAPVNRNTVTGSVSLKNAAGGVYGWTAAYENGDSTLVIQSAGVFEFLKKYTLEVSSILTSAAGTPLNGAVSINFVSAIDSSRKFPAITDNELLDKVEQQTFKYFWDFAHPVSNMARERSNGDNNVVTSGGSGFGVMAMLTGIERGFVTRVQGLAKLQTMVTFLKNTAQTFHGAYPHWLNGGTGAVIPFSANDNGADLVETSYLMQGLLCARQYFNGADGAETALRNDINSIWNRVEWDWFRQNDQNVLYWHYSPDKAWIMNMPIKGWNECLITYVLAASSPTHAVPKIAYTNGWAGNGSNGFTNGKTYYGTALPLGPELGGPLFFEHYSFLGINPNGLSDAYANYSTQTTNHTLINYNYCKANPNGYFGYSDSVWGLTASDIQNGYTASSPTNDVSYIAPTAALSSFPYTPVQSMQALKFYYYVLGDKIWKDYGFTDAFSLQNQWFADSFLAIDQGPIIVMIENYRTKLLWNLFTSCPEVKTGMLSLGFSAPYL